jgi:hypothetical protein
MIVRRFQDQVPINVARRVHIQNLRSRARIVQNCCLSSRRLDAYNNLQLHDRQIINSIRDILPTNIHANGVPYGVVAKPELYHQSYYRLALLYEREGMKLYNVFPLSTSAIPRHVMFDTLLLCKHVLGMPGTNLGITIRKMDYWGEVVDLKKKAFQSRSGMRFQGDCKTYPGSVRTDGVSISVILDKNQVRRRKRKRKSPPPSIYFEDNLDQIREKKVFCDPNRRDLLYCLGKDVNSINEAEEGVIQDANEGADATLRYTSVQRRKETRSKSHAQVREEIEMNAGLRGRGNQRIPTVLLPSRTTLDLIAYRLYLLNFFSTLQEKEQVYGREVFRKLRLSSYFLTQKSEAEFVKKVKIKYGQPH